jgi:hypothetical protein
VVRLRDELSGFILLIGTMEHIIINWLMVGNPKDLMEASDHLFDICVRLLQKDEKGQICPFITNGDHNKNSIGSAG